MSELEMYLCSLCNKAFSTKSHLQRHQKSTHRQSSSFLMSETADLSLQMLYADWSIACHVIFSCALIGRERLRPIPFPFTAKVDMRRSHTRLSISRLSFVKDCSAKSLFRRLKIKVLTLFFLYCSNPFQWPCPVPSTRGRGEGTLLVDLCYRNCGKLL